MKIHWRTFLNKRTPDKDKFPYGVRFYDGYMGAGKSLSMVFDAFQLAKIYKDLLLISNLKIKDFPALQYNFSNKEELYKYLMMIDNDEFLDHKHIMILIDEALPYFSENTGLSLGVVQSLTNLRKNKVLMCLCTQKFTRVNNRIRDFSKETVKCRSLFGVFQFNQVRDDLDLVWSKEDMDYIGRKKYSYIFKRNNKLFNSYDTLAKIKNSNTNDNDLLVAAVPPPPPQALQVKVKKGLF